MQTTQYLDLLLSYKDAFKTHNGKTTRKMFLEENCVSQNSMSSLSILNFDSDKKSFPLLNISKAVLL